MAKIRVNTGSSAGAPGKRPDNRCKRGGQRTQAQRRASSARRKTR